MLAFVVAHIKRGDRDNACWKMKWDDPWQHAHAARMCKLKKQAQCVRFMWEQ